MSWPLTSSVSRHEQLALVLEVEVERRPEIPARVAMPLDAELGEARALARSASVASRTAASIWARFSV
jgi:hypothetical protein